MNIQDLSKEELERLLSKSNKKIKFLKKRNKKIKSNNNDLKDEVKYLNYRISDIIHFNKGE